MMNQCYICETKKLDCARVVTLKRGRSFGLLCAPCYDAVEAYLDEEFTISHPYIWLNADEHIGTMFLPSGGLVILCRNHCDGGPALFVNPNEKHIITIEVRGGGVVQVSNLPIGVDYEIKDWDNCDKCGMTDPDCEECRTNIIIKQEGSNDNRKSDQGATPYPFPIGGG